MLHGTTEIVEFSFVLIIVISIFAQVNITNPTRWLVKFDVLICYIHLQLGEYNKIEIFKMVAIAVLLKLVIKN
jgi:hypothetical protein